jgi:HSP20 family molecular chaperone IbpA
MAIVPSRKNEERSLAQRGGEPLSHLRNQINRVFDDFFGESWLTPRREMAAGFWPQVDVTETDKEIKVSADIPGVEPKDIDCERRGRHADYQRREEIRARRKGEGAASNGAQLWLV